tara:strand:+ start:48 stop:497 length:450 start_codon:yes stop_codon:yes gene_type:complete
MKIVLPSLIQNQNPGDFEATNNKYVLKQNGKPYVDIGAVKSFLMPFSSPVVKNGNQKTLATNLFLTDTAWGWGFFSRRLDLNTELTEEQLEEYILQSVSIYLFKKIGKFPLKKGEKIDMSPEDFKDPDDMPPIDKELDEMELNINDFKL